MTVIPWPTGQGMRGRVRYPERARRLSMLDGRSIIEIESKIGLANSWRVWLVRFDDGHQFVRQAFRLSTGRWLIVGPSPVIEPSLREARRCLFGGNGRLTGGHPEITDPVRGPMSRVNAYAIFTAKN